MVASSFTITYEARVTKNIAPKAIIEVEIRVSQNLEEPWGGWPIQF